MKVRILLAEDNPADVFLVCEALKENRIEFELLLANDGEAAIGIIERADADSAAPCPDLAILDMNLPRRDGHSVLARLRTSLRFGAIPVVVFTSANSPRDRLEAKRMGATSYFLKPDDLDAYMQFGAVIRSILEDRAAQAERA